MLLWELLLEKLLAGASVTKWAFPRVRPMVQQSVLTWVQQTVLPTVLPSVQLLDSAMETVLACSSALPLALPTERSLANEWGPQTVLPTVLPLVLQSAHVLAKRTVLPLVH